MDAMEVESRLRDLLLPVFGLDSIDEIHPEHSLVNDLGADSIDFVEIVYVIESNFGVAVKANDLITGTENMAQDTLFEDDILTTEGVDIVRKNLTGCADRIKAGMTKVDIFSLITVRDMADFIRIKMGGG